MATAERKTSGPSSPETLADAAKAAVLDHRLAISRDPSSLRSVTVELELDRLGRLVECSAYVQRNLTTAQALGYRKGGG